MVMILRFMLFGLLTAWLGGCGGGTRYLTQDYRTESQWRPLARTEAGQPLADPSTRPPPTEVPVRKVKMKGAYVLVFDIRDQSGKLSPMEADGLTEYLAGKLAEGGLFHVIPRSEIKQRLGDQKKDSYRECYDQSCQIEIGREMAAEKTLSVSIRPIGSSCVITAALYDLKKAATDATATARGPCSEDEYLTRVEEIVERFRRMAE